VGAQIIELARSQVRSLYRSQKIRDAPVLFEKRPTCRLSRMSRENRLDVEVIENTLKFNASLLRRMARSFTSKPPKCVFNGASLRLIRSVAFVISLAPYSMVLLGDVDELKIDGKRTNHSNRLIQCQPRQQPFQASLDRWIVPCPQLLAKSPNSLFGSEESLTTETAKGFAEQIAEQVYVCSQGNVLGLRHLC
jgi:hypothetical protein